MDLSGSTGGAADHSRDPAAGRYPADSRTGRQLEEANGGKALLREHMFLSKEILCHLTWEDTKAIVEVGLRPTQRRETLVAAKKYIHHYRTRNVLCPRLNEFIREKENHPLFDRKRADAILQKSEKLAAVVDEIITYGAPKTWPPGYNLAYELFTELLPLNPSGVLYETYQHVVERVAEERLSLDKHASIQQLAEAWRSYRKVANSVRNVFMYADRYFVSLNHVPSTKELLLTTGHEVMRKKYTAIKTASHDDILPLCAEEFDRQLSAV